MSQKLASIALVAKHTFERNIDTMVAGFLIRNPDIDPADVELVMSTIGGTMRFSIEPKELHVPPVCEILPSYAAAADGRETVDGARARGWNECRQAMIETTRKARPEAAMVASLDSMTDILAGEGNG